jgi:hypothetical protein
VRHWSGRECARCVRRIDWLMPSYRPKAAAQPRLSLGKAEYCAARPAAAAAHAACACSRSSATRLAGAPPRPRPWPWHFVRVGQIDRLRVPSAPIPSAQAHSPAVSRALREWCRALTRAKRSLHLADCSTEPVASSHAPSRTGASNVVCCLLSGVVLPSAFGAVPWLPGRLLSFACVGCVLRGPRRTNIVCLRILRRAKRYRDWVDANRRRCREQSAHNIGCCCRRRRRRRSCGAAAAAAAVCRRGCG